MFNSRDSDSVQGEAPVAGVSVLLPFGFTVREGDLEPSLKERVERRTTAEERRDVLIKLLRNMIIDMDTLSLISADDLTSDEVCLTQR